MPKGTHDNHPKASQHPRWKAGSQVASNGYLKVRVGKGHPLSDPNGYAYEHLVVWCAAGRKRPERGEILHHKNGDKTDNRLENLELLTKEQHAKEHHLMIPDNAVRILRERYAAGDDGTALAVEFGISFQSVYKMLRGKVRRSAGGPIQHGSLRGKKRAGRLLDGREWSEYPR